MGWNFFAEKKLGRSTNRIFLLHEEYGHDGRNKVWNQANCHGFDVIYVYYSQHHLFWFFSSAVCSFNISPLFLEHLSIVWDQANN